MLNLVKGFLIQQTLQCFTIQYDVSEELDELYHEAEISKNKGVIFCY